MDGLNSVGQLDLREPRVLIVGNYPGDQQYSMRLFSRTLADNLSGLGLRVTLTEPPLLAGRLAAKRPALVKLFGYIDKYLVFPMMLRAKAARFDVVHIADHSNAPYRAFVGDKPVVVTCHDLFAVQIMLGEVPGQRFGVPGNLLQRWVLGSLRRICRFTSVSGYSAEELRRITGTTVPIEHIPNALADHFRQMPEEESADALTRIGVPVTTRFFLHVGGNNFYKNRSGVVRLFEQLGGYPQFACHRLVLAGKAPDPALRRVIENSPLRERIDVRVGVDDHGICALYNRAEALLFVSLKEGFGWPVVEAQACGCLVVTTDAEPMRTVAGGAAILVDPTDPVGAAEAVVQKHPLFEALRAAGLSNAKAYTAERVFPRYLGVYRSGHQQALDKS